MNIIHDTSVAAKATVLFHSALHQKNYKACIILVKDEAWDRVANEHVRLTSKMHPARAEREPWPSRAELGIPPPSYSFDGKPDSDVQPEVLAELLERGLYASRVFNGYMVYGMTYKGALLCSLLEKGIGV